MSASMNGRPMTLSVGDGSSVAGLLSVGANYCARHLPQIPRVSPETIRKYCTLPWQRPAGAAESAKPKIEPVRLSPEQKAAMTQSAPTRPKYRKPAKAEETAVLRFWNVDKLRVCEIATKMGASRDRVRSILRGLGVDTKKDQKRVIVLAALRSGKSREEAMKVARCSKYYVATIANKLGVRAQDRRAA